MSDLEDEMEETAERAKALGVSGDQPTDPSELIEASEDEGGETVSETVASSETQASSEALETSEPSEVSETSEPSEALEMSEASEAQEIGGLDDHVYPNPDKERGSLIDTYENFNVYVPPEVKSEVNAFYKQLDYEFSQASDDELDKHWDFYTALFRAVLQNRELVRAELEMDDTE